MRRAGYRSHNEFICTKPIRLGPNEITEPGTEIDKTKFRRQMLRAWYGKRKIMNVGDPKADAYIEKWERDKALLKEAIKKENTVKSFTLDFEDDLVALAVDLSEMSVEEWKEFSFAEVALFLDATLSVINHEDYFYEGLDADFVEGTITFVEEFVKTFDKLLKYIPTETEEAPAEPYKVGSQWAIEDIDKKFSSRKKAQAHIDSLEG